MVTWEEIFFVGVSQIPLEQSISNEQQSSFYFPVFLDFPPVLLVFVLAFEGLIESNIYFENFDISLN